MKNLFGYVPGKVKVRWHWPIGKDPNRFGEMLVETARLLAPELESVDFPTLKPEGCRVEDWQLAERSQPVYFSLPRVVLSTLKDWSIRHIQEPIASYRGH